MNEYLHTIILGILQGLGEFLPISSSGHLLLAPYLFGWNEMGDNAKLVYDCALHVGTTAALIIFFWKDLTSIFGALIKKEVKAEPNRRLAWLLLMGCVPAAIIGVLGESKIEAIFRNSPRSIATALIVMGVILWIADRLSKRNRGYETLKPWEAISIGLAQALALIPGVSRSGATLTAGLSMGLSREAAARFSFLMSAPITLGAALWAFRHLVKTPPNAHYVGLLVVGAITSAVVGYVCIAFMLNYIKKHSMTLFTVYRLVLGVGVFVVWYMRQ